tara:strand:- start:211 stop:438 length:228 start_codon:yes stop_codon:yes gene_type:complete
MGASKRLYFLTTQPLEEVEFWEFYKRNKDVIQDNWKCDENDRELFKQDEDYKKLLKAKTKASKDLEEHKERVRNQ